MDTKKPAAGRWMVALAAMAMCWLYGRATACLRETMDDRAVQWSTLIVQAKLASVGKPAAMGAATQPATRAAEADGTQVQTFTFSIVATLDGTAKVGDQITVVNFFRPGEQDSSICGEDMGHAQIGKSFVLLLRPENLVEWSRKPGVADPRPDSLQDPKSFVVVHVESSQDMGDDGIADLRETIGETRSAEAQYSAADARSQAHTLATAADDTEAADAEHALTEMGFKAIPDIRAELSSADDVGKLRLNHVINTLSVPGLVDDLGPANATP